MRAEPTSRTFLKQQNTRPGYDTARAVIIQVPYEGTVSYGKGPARAPEAIIDASAYLETYEIELGCCPVDMGIAALPPLKPSRTPDQMSAAAGRLTARVLADEKKPVVLGGEHSISSGPILACAAACPGLGVLHLDAHSDLRDEYTGTRFSHGCVMRRVMELNIPHAAIGIRSMCADEARFIQSRKIPICTARDFSGYRVRQLLAGLPRDLYVSFDVDALDPSIMPGTGTPEPGGLTWFDALDILDEIVRQKKRVIGFDVMEVAPIRGSTVSEFTAAKLVYLMMGMFWAKA
jgi:agmatinase